MFSHRHVALPIVVIAGLAALSVLLLAAWRREDPVPPVILTEVERGPIRDVVPALGRIRAANQVEVGTEVGGRILRVAVKPEQEVQANDLLAVIDPEPFENALTTARARLLTARSAEAEAGPGLARPRQSWPACARWLKTGPVRNRLLKIWSSRSKRCLQSATGRSRGRACRE